MGAFLVLQQQRKRSDETMSASRSAHAQEILAASAAILPRALIHPFCCQAGPGAAPAIPGALCSCAGHCQPCPPAPGGTGASVTFSLCCRDPPVTSQTAFVPALSPAKDSPACGGCQWFKLWFTRVSLALFPNLNDGACSRRTV